jgi:hypothetical protein
LIRSLSKEMTMRKLTIAAVGAAALAGAGALALAPSAGAQPAAPPAGGAAATVMPGPWAGMPPGQMSGQAGGPTRGPQAGAWMQREEMERQGGAWMEGRGGPWGEHQGAERQRAEQWGAEQRGPERQGGPWAERGDIHRGWMHLVRTWALFHRPADLGLSPADVQTIAEGILLRNGQHDWKVGDVTPNADHTVSFAFTTAHGDVIAHFTMDTRTGRITRTD